LSRIIPPLSSQQPAASEKAFVCALACQCCSYSEGTHTSRIGLLLLLYLTALRMGMHSAGESAAQKALSPAGQAQGKARQFYPM